MSKTETVHTAYGETSIEVVECDSCGNTVAKNTASRFAIDSNVPNPQFNEAERVGYACEHCVSEGPASFPEQAREKAKLLKRDGDLFFGILIWPFTALMIIMMTNGEWERGYAIASVGGVLWSILLVIGCVMLL